MQLYTYTNKPYLSLSILGRNKLRNYLYEQYLEFNDAVEQTHNLNQSDGWRTILSGYSNISALGLNSVSDSPFTLRFYINDGVNPIETITLHIKNTFFYSVAPGTGLFIENIEIKTDSETTIPIQSLILTSSVE